MPAPKRYAASTLAKNEGWFSCRHRTGEACSKFRQENKQRLEQKYDDSLRRSAEAKKRTPEEQLVRLDKRLGKGQGAAKERQRLASKLSS